MEKVAMWTHGHAFTVSESPADMLNVEDNSWTDIVGLRQGSGSFYRGKSGKSIWVHVSIPTPVIFPTASIPEGDRARISKVHVLFDAKPSVFLQALHIWDGQNRIFGDGFNLVNEMRPNGIDGFHGSALEDGINSFLIPEQPLVFWGIGFSVLIRFNSEDTIRFISAGADYLI